MNPLDHLKPGTHFPTFYHSTESPMMNPLAGLSLLKPQFDPRSVHVRFVADKVALKHIFLPVVVFPPVSITPPTLHTHLHLHVAVTRRTNGLSLGTFQKAALFGNREGLGKIELPLLFRPQSVNGCFSRTLRPMGTAEVLDDICVHKWHFKPSQLYVLLFPVSSVKKIRVPAFYWRRFCSFRNQN